LQARHKPKPFCFIELLPSHSANVFPTLSRRDQQANNRTERVVASMHCLQRRIRALQNRDLQKPPEKGSGLPGTQSKGEPEWRQLLALHKIARLS
jgi:hypothetical protein